MAWCVEFQLSARKQISKLDRAVQVRILDFFRQRIAGGENPRLSGKALKGNRGELWRYRIGDYRAICRIEDMRLVVLVLEVGHRKEIYR
ncbi:MAG: type II toxin-antitoxin system RelE family toxin [Chthoniobacterales bacterium]